MTAKLAAKPRSLIQQQEKKQGREKKWEELKGKLDKVKTPREHWTILGDTYIGEGMFDQHAKEIAERYSKAQASEINKDLEMQVCDLVLKYLLFSLSPSPERATENSISENLGIQRSRLRKILGLLEWAEIIQSINIGTCQPYVVKNIGKALAEGYLAFNEEEARLFPRLSGHTGEEIYHPRKTTLRALRSSLPQDENLLKMGDWVKRLWKPIIQIRRPFNPNTVSSTIPVEQDRTTLQTFIDEFIENGSIVREVLLELRTPDLDQVTEKEFFEALGEVAAKHLRLAMMLLRPLAHCIEENGFADCHLAIGKSYYKDEMLRTHSGSISFGELPIDRPIWDPDIGYIGYQTEKLGIQQVRLAIGFLRGGICYAERAKADKTVIEEAALLANILEAATEKNYRGIEEEGISLEEWYKKLGKA